MGLIRIPAAVAVLALVLVDAAGARHQDGGEARAAARTDGRVFTAAADLRRHVVASGRSWETFLDRRRRVVAAYHLRQVVWAGRTYYSEPGLERMLAVDGGSYRRWKRDHPARYERLRTNARAQLPVATYVSCLATGRSLGAPLGARMGFALDNAEYQGTSERDRELAEVAAAGAQWIRIDVKWADVQSISSESFEWAKYDALLGASAARGLRVLATLAYSPAWARPLGASDKFAPETASRREAYARFASAAVTRYRERVSAWEIWNEPNSSKFWGPAPDPGSYAALLRHAYPAIKTVDPRAIVVAGATAPASTGDGMIDEVRFLQGVYAAGGRPYFDAWSHHPYDFNLAPGTPHSNSGWWQTYGSTPSIRSVMKSVGDAGKEVWATEFGVPSSGYGGLTEVAQAERLGMAYSCWRRFPWAGGIFNYLVRDRVVPDVPTFWSHLGVTRNDWSRKPAFSVTQKAARGS